MKVSEIYELEKNNLGCCYLIKEDIFRRVYEEVGYVVLCENHSSPGKPDYQYRNKCEKQLKQTIS